MYIIDKITQVLVIFLVILLAVFASAAVWYIRMKRRGKKTKLSDDGADYQGLERRNALDYVKFDDIRDDMILAENNTRFIAVLRCQGFDFYYGHIAEQYAAQNGYLGFLNTVTKPITYRQYTKAVDLEHTQDNYATAYNEIQEALFNLSEDYKAAKQRLREKEQDLEKEGGSRQEAHLEISCMLDHLISMQREIEALEWRLLHVRDQLAYLDQLAEKSGAPVSMETYVFDWVYDPMDFPVEMTDDEIAEKAKEELKRLARQKINALSTAGVKAYRCTTDELIDMVRRHFQPLSSDRYRMRNVGDSSYYSDITFMEGKDRLKKAYDEELTLDIVRAINREFEDGAEGTVGMENAGSETKGKGDGGIADDKKR